VRRNDGRKQKKAGCEQRSGHREILQRRPTKRSMKGQHCRGADNPAGPDIFSTERMPAVATAPDARWSGRSRRGHNAAGNRGRWQPHERSTRVWSGQQAAAVANNMSLRLKIQRELNPPIGPVVTLAMPGELHLYEQVQDRVRPLPQQRAVP